jgi:hypothetical protein
MNEKKKAPSQKKLDRIADEHQHKGPEGSSMSESLKQTAEEEAGQTKLNVNIENGKVVLREGKETVLARFSSKEAVYIGHRLETFGRKLGES